MWKSVSSIWSIQAPWRWLVQMWKEIHSSGKCLYFNSCLIYVRTPYKVTCFKFKIFTKNLSIVEGMSERIEGKGLNTLNAFWNDRISQHTLHSILKYLSSWRITGHSQDRYALGVLFQLSYRERVYVYAVFL